jgi:zinc D-Ala-D-Ala carboxypeptidase
MSDERITPSFYLSEFLITQQRGLDNMPKAVQLANIRNVLAPGMQAVRELLGAPVLISSGYRSPAVNKAVGGTSRSQHCQGLAADFTAPHFGSPLEICRKILDSTAIRFDQLIHEGSWVHISFVASEPRRQVLTAHFLPTGVVYSPGLSR